MAFRLFSDVRETSLTGGAGDLVLAGAIDPTYFAFAARYGGADTGIYAARQGSSRELGVFTYNSGPNSITRSKVIKSTNANAAVAFAAGVLIDLFVADIGPSDISLTDSALVALLPAWFLQQFGYYRTVTAAGDVTVAASDCTILLNKTTGAATNIVMPTSASRNGAPLTVVDYKRDAQTNNITFVPQSGETLHGLSAAAAVTAGYALIDANGGSKTYWPLASGGWYLKG